MIGSDIEVYAARLRDLEPGRVYVNCSSCKRSGRYTVASLRERFGPDISTLDVLRHLTASCRYQRAPGSSPARRYEHLCLAAITLRDRCRIVEKRERPTTTSSAALAHSPP